MKSSLKVYLITLIISFVCIGLSCYCAFTCDTTFEACAWVTVALLTDIIGMSISANYAELEHKQAELETQLEDLQKAFSIKFGLLDKLNTMRFKHIVADQKKQNEMINSIADEVIDNSKSDAEVLDYYTLLLQQVKSLEKRVADLEAKKIIKKK